MNKPFDIAEVYNGQENLSCVKWIAARIQKHNFCSIHEWLKSTSLLDLANVKTCIMVLKGEGPLSNTDVGFHSPRAIPVDEAPGLGYAQIASMQVIHVAEMLSLGEGLPTIFDDAMRSTMAVALVQVYVMLEMGARTFPKDFEVKTEKFSMDPDFVMTDWSRLVRFNAYDKEQRSFMMMVEEFIENARAARKYIQENLSTRPHGFGFGYEEPKVDQTKLAANPQNQVDDLAERLKNLLGKQ